MPPVLPFPSDDDSTVDDTSVDPDAAGLIGCLVLIVGFLLVLVGIPLVVLLWRWAL